MKKLILILLFNFLFLNETFAQLNKIETDDFEIVSTNPQFDYVLNHAIRCSHNALQFHTHLFEYDPQEKIFVLFQDFGDYGNGGATSLPNNLISTCISPLNYAFESSVAGERVFSIMNHELVHIVALDNASKSDLFYRKLFMGKVKSSNDHPISIFYSYLTNPRYYSPRWLHEGIAVFVETWMGGGTGNALGNYDEMFFRTRVLEGSRIYSAQGLAAAGTSADFMSKANYYYYGTRFVSYLAYHYGPEQLMEWIKRKDDSKRGYQAQFKHVFGITLSEAWKDWIAFENDFQNKALDKLKQNTISKDSLITDKVLGGISLAYHDSKHNKVYVAVNYPGKIPHLAALDLKTGKLKRLHDIKGPTLFNVTSLTYDENNDLLFYTTDNDAKRDLNVYNLKTGHSKLLQKDTSIGDLAFNKADGSLWGIKHLNGISTLVRLPKTNPEDPTDHHYSTWEQKYTLPYGYDMFDIDISPDGSSLSAALTDINGNQYLNIYDIESFNAFDKANITFKEVFNFDVASPQSFKYSADGSYLLGTSYYSGVSNIFKVDTKTLDIEILTNALTGYFRPIPIDDEKLFAFKYTSNGFAPVYVYKEEAINASAIAFLGNKTVEKYPELKDWTTEVPNAQNFDDEQLHAKTGTYFPGKELKLTYAYPTLIGYINKFGIGYQFKFQDPLGLRSIDVSLGYTPNQWNNGIDNVEGDIANEEEFHLSMNYSTAKLSGFLAGKYNFYAYFNRDDFYDLFGPTKRSRKGIHVGFDYDQSLIYDNPKNLDFNFGSSFYYGLNQSPYFQQIEFPDQNFNSDLFYNIFTSLTYKDLRGSVGAVDAEKGIKSSISLNNSITKGNFFPALIGTLDVGFQLPIKHTSFWVRNALGNSFSKDFNPFTRFSFAAFGNNYIDNKESKMYRRPYSLAGLSYDADKIILAKRFYKTTLELLLPPIRYRKLGFNNLFATHTHASLFAGGLFASNYDTTRVDENLDPEYSENFRNLGFQIDTKFVMFSHLSSTFSFGWARAFDLGNDRSSFDEWMISLKF